MAELRLTFVTHYMPRVKRSQSQVGSGSAMANYRALLTDIKARIRVAQVKASLSVNRELIQLYWDIGERIVIRQRDQGWGKSVVERLAADLQKGFPGIAGFSPQNIWYMRAFYLAWTEDVRILDVALDESDRIVLQRSIGDSGTLRPPAVVAQIPWGQNIELVTKLRNPVQRLWYAQQTISNGWSRIMLVHLPVDGEDFYIDLLFYHLKLRCYVVIDLKTTAFKPEYVGKMSFYLAAVDDRLRHADDKLSIGLILCKTRSEVVAEYALRKVGAPVGIARYTTKLVESLPAELAGALPSCQELQAELGAASLRGV